MPDIYEIATSLGDSLALSQEAAETDADVIVFCGVHFMAESAAILNPEKTVLLPARDAGCLMADMVTAPALRKMKKQYPGVPVVCYVNSSAAVKAESDICCTSANAVDVVMSLQEKQILMVPDRNLSAYVQSQLPEKELIPWDGCCPVHDDIRGEQLKNLKTQRPEAVALVHPECRPEVLEHADIITSTSGMLRQARENQSEQFIIVTECGMVNMLRREVPDKRFFKLCNVCHDMKKIDLAAVKKSLEKMQYHITVPKRTAEKARIALERMMAIPRGQGG